MGDVGPPRVNIISSVAIPYLRPEAVPRQGNGFLPRRALRAFDDGDHRERALGRYPGALLACLATAAPTQCTVLHTSTLHAPCSMLHALRSTLHAPRSTLHTAGTARESTHGAGGLGPACRPRSFATGCIGICASTASCTLMQSDCVSHARLSPTDKENKSPPLGDRRGLGKRLNRVETGGDGSRVIADRR